MGLFVLILIALCAYGLIRFLASMGAWATGTRYRALRRLAARYGGRCESRGLSDPPIVTFAHGEDMVRVGLAPSVPGRPAPPTTRIVVRFRRGIPFRLELAPVDRHMPRQSPKGTSPVQVGDREFDGGFIVQANDADMARDFLCPAARWAIHGLQRLVHPGGLLIAISPERLLVQIDRNLGNNVEALFEAVAETLIIQDGLQAGVRKRMSDGVTLVEGEADADPWEDAGPPLCKVCGEAINGGPIVVCARCNTPHHRECWEYVGWCSIYGCGGKAPKSPSLP